MPVCLPPFLNVNFTRIFKTREEIIKKEQERHNRDVKESTGARNHHRLDEI